MTDSDNDTLQEYKAHLTGELRELFDAKGYELVHQELIYNRYEALEKRKAAVAWMAEGRDKKSRAEWVKFWIPVTLSAIAICISVAAIALRARC